MKSQVNNYDVIIDARIGSDWIVANGKLIAGAWFESIIHWMQGRFYGVENSLEMPFWPNFRWEMEWVFLCNG